jgi:hypothetical protein
MRQYFREHLNNAKRGAFGWRFSTFCLIKITRTRIEKKNIKTKTTHPPVNDGIVDSVRAGIAVGHPTLT